MSTALVIGDVQVGIIETFEWSARVLGPLEDVLQHARARQTPVVFARAGLREAAADIPASNPIATWMHGAGSLFRERSPETSVHPRLEPAPDEPVVVKRRVSAFAGTDLDAVLRARGITSIVLAGVATTGVVLATLLAAADLDYSVTVLSDCCADQDEDVHQLLMAKVFPGRGATVMTARDWVAKTPGL